MNPEFLAEREAELRARYRFAGLMRPLVGLVERVELVLPEQAAPQLDVAAASLGNLTYTWPHVSTPDGRDARAEALLGGGADGDSELAWLRALVEAVERYCSLVLDERRVIYESAASLGRAALDLTRLPALSPRELADPACPLGPVRLDRPIRWLPGFSLTAGEPRYVPAALTHLLTAVEPDERFALQITTGTAAHTDLAEALVAGLCEVIERDAVALTWLARLPLREIALDAVTSAELREQLAVLGRSTVRQRFFDATTDLGVPTVFAVALCEGHPQLAQTVSCATGFDFEALVAKNVRESVPVRATLRHAPPPPADVRDFTALHEGALRLGVPEARPEFAFLLEHGRAPRPLSELPRPAARGARARLACLVARCRALGVEAVAVDLATDEARRAGLHVVRVVVTDLMPLSPIHRARFLGTPRLYDYPRRAGYGALREDDVNAAPQPFA